MLMPGLRPHGDLLMLGLRPHGDLLMPGLQLHGHRVCPKQGGGTKTKYCAVLCIMCCNVRIRNA